MLQRSGKDISRRLKTFKKTTRCNRERCIIMISVKHENLTVLHIATPNQPIGPDLGYGPIETVIQNIDKGLHSLGHRSIVACSGDSRVFGEHYVTVDQSIGDYWSDTPRNGLRAIICTFQGYWEGQRWETLISYTRMMQKRLSSFMTVYSACIYQLL